MILGDMFELGNESQEEHKTIINSLLDKNGITIYFVGNEFFKNKVESVNFSFFETFDTFSEHLQELKINTSSILIKGSRGMALERTLNFL